MTKKELTQKLNKVEKIRSLDYWKEVDCCFTTHIINSLANFLPWTDEIRGRHILDFTQHEFDQHLTYQTLRRKYQKKLAEDEEYVYPSADRMADYLSNDYLLIIAKDFLRYENSGLFAKPNHRYLKNLLEQYEKKPKS